MAIRLFEDYRPHPGQTRFRNSTARFKNIVAGRRWGKDYSCAREFIRKVFTRDFPKVQHLKPPSERFAKYTKPLLHYWAVAPDYNIGKIQQREIFSIFPPEFQASTSHFNYDDNKKELRLLGSRILIEFKSADRQESLVGVGLDGVYCTEFARFKEDAWDANIRPTLTDKRGWGLFATTPLPREWFVRFVALGDPKSGTYAGEGQHENFFGKTIDNVRLPDIEAEVDLARRTLPPKYFKREYEASMSFFEGQIFEEWDVDLHAALNLRLPRFDLVIAGVDWGFANPGSIMLIGVKLNRGTIPTFYLVDENYEQGVLLDGDGDSWVQRALLLKGQHNPKIFYCDSAEPGYIKAFRHRGINAIGADKDVNAGIQSLATAMHISEVDGLPHFYVVRQKCPHFCAQVIQYQWDKDEKPLKENDHTIDAVRYAIHTYMKYGGRADFSYSLEDNDRV